MTRDNMAAMQEAVSLLLHDLAQRTSDPGTHGEARRLRSRVNAPDPVELATESTDDDDEAPAQEVKR